MIINVKLYEGCPVMLEQLSIPFKQRSAEVLQRLDARGGRVLSDGWGIIIIDPRGACGCGCKDSAAGIRLSQRSR